MSLTGTQTPRLTTAVPGPRSRAMARRLHRVESRNITCVGPDGPIFWQRARGANVWDADGNRYIDLTAAFGVAGVGHDNPRVAAALKSQAGRLLHAMGDVHPNELKLRLAAELGRLSFGRWQTRQPEARVIFANSGAEAVEAALKTAMIHTGRPGVIAFEGGYHGLTYGALEVTWRRDFREPFRAQLGGFAVHAPFGRVPDIGDPGRFGAVIVEPIQGRGGIVVPPSDFLPGLRRFCDRHGLALIADEIYTGFCRTGKWFACEHWGVAPDIICVGKAMSGGFPMSACVGRAAVMDSWPVSQGEALHTSTFLGNPLGCAAALAAIAEARRMRLDARARSLGRHLRRQLGRMAGRGSGIRDVRGAGLMLGVEFDDPARVERLIARLLRRGIIALPEGNRGEVLGITPPLVITKRQLDYCLAVLKELLG
jgi:4-aminobutyrate aminotransferase-like enzyme